MALRPRCRLKQRAVQSVKEYESISAGLRYDADSQDCQGSLQPTCCSSIWQEFVGAAFGRKRRPA